MSATAAGSNRRECTDRTNDCQPKAANDNSIIRWYIMSLPSSRGKAAADLQAELDRRINYGEPAFDYFAPTYVAMHHRGGKLVKTERPLLYNYIFINSSVRELWRMKQRLPHINFLRRITDTGGSHFPYLTDEAMDNLRWVARSYCDALPVCQPDVERLRKGDKVRITDGQFAGIEATVVSQPGAGQKDIMVCIDDWMWVPLLHVSAGQYEVIELNGRGKHTYTSLDNDRIIDGLHDALTRHISGQATEADRTLAGEALRLCSNIVMTTDVMRCKQCHLLLIAYTLLDDRAGCERQTAEALALLPLLTAEQSRALLLTTLYGCTDNSRFQTEAHTIIDPWRKEPALKKSKRRLIDWLDGLDERLGH